MHLFSFFIIHVPQCAIQKEYSDASLMTFHNKCACTWYKTFSLTRDPGSLVRILSSKYFSPCFKILWVHTHVFYSNSIICLSIMCIRLNSGLQIRVCNRKLLFLFFNQNICCWYSKEPSRWDGSFEHPKQVFKLVDNKIIAILSSKILLYWPYVNYITSMKIVNPCPFEIWPL